MLLADCFVPRLSFYLDRIPRAGEWRGIAQVEVIQLLDLHTVAATVKGTPEEIDRAFNQAFAALDRRISLFLCLPLASLDKLALQKEIDRIGHQ
jgi:hypothetical protein